MLINEAAQAGTFKKKDQLDQWSLDQGPESVDMPKCYSCSLILNMSNIKRAMSVEFLKRRVRGVNEQNMKRTQIEGDCSTLHVLEPFPCRVYCKLSNE